MEEGLPSAESFVALTNFDEENIMLSLFVKSISKAKLITKVHRISYDEIIGGMELGSLIYPKYITAESIVKHVRALQNSIGSNIETLYRMSNDRVEALEFIVKEDSPVFLGIKHLAFRLKPSANQADYQATCNYIQSYNMHLMRAESPGPSVGKLVPKIKNTAMILYGIYLAITLIEITALMLAGLNLYEAATLSFSTTGTGGFGLLNTSIGSYSTTIQVIFIPTKEAPPVSAPTRPCPQSSG